MRAFSPEDVQGNTTLEIKQYKDRDGRMVVLPSESPTSFAPESIHPLAVVLVCIVVAYPVGYGMLIVGLVKETRRVGARSVRS